MPCRWARKGRVYRFRRRNPCDSPYGIRIWTCRSSPASMVFAPVDASRADEKRERGNGRMEDEATGSAPLRVEMLRPAHPPLHPRSQSLIFLAAVNASLRQVEAHPAVSVRSPFQSAFASLWTPRLAR